MLWESRLRSSSIYEQVNVFDKHPWTRSTPSPELVREGLFFLEAMEVTENQLAVCVTEMHPIAAAIAPVSAGGAFPGFHPAVVTVYPITVIPHIHEVIALVDIALAVVCADAGAGCNGAVGHNGTYGYSCAAKEEMVPDIALIITKKAFTAITDFDTAFTPSAFYKLHQATELFS